MSGSVPHHFSIGTSKLRQLSLLGAASRDCQRLLLEQPSVENDVPHVDFVRSAAFTSETHLNVLEKSLYKVS